MKPHLADPDATIYVGEALDVLRELEPASVDCIVTSPPYFGLRDYRVEGQLGAERTWPEYVERLVAIFREARRVLRGTGTAWLNLGDTYATGAGRVGVAPGGGPRGERWKTKLGPMTATNRLPQPGLKRKELMGIPWRVAFALQEDGWYLRAENIWHKLNVTPESAKDRTTRAHEHVFHLTKSARYWYDAEAVEEPAAWDKWGAQTTPKVFGKLARASFIKPRAFDELPRRDTRNLRSVWSLPTANYPGDHEAVMPERLAAICIAAGCPTSGIVLDPFGGVGTTAYVARLLGRHSISIELNPDSARQAAERLAQLGLFAEATA